MKVQTDLKAGGGLLGIVAVVIIDVDVNFGCGCRRQSHCGGGGKDW